MGELTDAIPRGSLVGIDTAVFIYQIEAAPTYRHVVGPFFAALARGEYRGVTSVIALMEIAVRPLQLERPEVADDYELLLVTYPHLTVTDIDRWIARRAAELRAQYRLRPADSLQAGETLRIIHVVNGQTTDLVSAGSDSISYSKNRSARSKQW